MDLDTLIASARRSSQALARHRRRPSQRFATMLEVKEADARAIEAFTSRLEAAELQARELAIEVGLFLLEQGFVHEAGRVLQNPGDAHKLLDRFGSFARATFFIPPPRED